MKRRLPKLLVRLVVAALILLGLRLVYGAVLGWRVGTSKSILEKEACVRFLDDPTPRTQAPPPTPAFYQEIHKLESIETMPFAPYEARATVEHARIVCGGSFRAACWVRQADAMKRAMAACMAELAWDDPRASGCYAPRSMDEEDEEIRRRHALTDDDRAFCDAWTEFRSTSNEAGVCRLCNLQ